LELSSLKLFREGYDEILEQVCRYSPRDEQRGEIENKFEKVYDKLHKELNNRLKFAFNTSWQTWFTEEGEQAFNQYGDEEKKAEEEALKALGAQFKKIKNTDDEK